MKRLIKILLGITSTVLGSAVYAYEIDTHERLSVEAYEASQIRKDSELLRSLGVKDTDKFKNSENSDRTIRELIGDGSRFEDEVIKLKSLFHFYDPIHDEGLLFFTSPTWALEDKGKIHLLQNYSFGDARDAFYDALIATDENDRKAKFGKTFEALGHVIHHVQDMAQPQHVRLDDHLRLDWTQEELPLEKRSRYEQYTKDKGGNLPFGTYAPVNAPTDISFLTTARSFWTTGRGGGERPGGVHQPRLRLCRHQLRR